MGSGSARGIDGARRFAGPRRSHPANVLVKASRELRSGAILAPAPEGAAQRMTEARTERKLAAILAATVAGYSRLMMSADQVNPDFSLAQHVRVLPYENPRDLERITDGLAKAGLP